MAAEATLEIEAVPVQAWCGTCLQEFASEEMFCVCPTCQGLGQPLKGGKELELGSLEVS